MRIFKLNILTYHGFSDSESDILEPRWLLTGGAIVELTLPIGAMSVEERNAS